MDIKLDFIEIDYKECAEKLLKYPSRISLFYMDNKSLRPISNEAGFIYAVALELKVYQQFING